MKQSAIAPPPFQAFSEQTLAVIYDVERGVIYFKPPSTAQSEALEACVSGHVPRPNVWLGLVTRDRANACAQLLRETLPRARDPRVLVILDPLPSDTRT